MFESTTKQAGRNDRSRLGEKLECSSQSAHPGPKDCQTSTQQLVSLYYTRDRKEGWERACVRERVGRAFFLAAALPFFFCTQSTWRLAKVIRHCSLSPPLSSPRRTHATPLSFFFFPFHTWVIARPACLFVIYSLFSWKIKAKLSYWSDKPHRKPSWSRSENVNNQKLTDEQLSSSALIKKQMKNNFPKW